ncbi:G-protein coupled receptor moody-like [Babylonia areolata]|uniref:G-protein coupled receptor moody-like n=1 Tax=Babylonia areolata TaxID=304850 RepID=UPI003FD409CC
MEEYARYLPPNHHHKHHQNSSSSPSSPFSSSSSSSFFFSPTFTVSRLQQSSSSSSSSSSLYIINNNNNNALNNNLTNTATNTNTDACQGLDCYPDEVFTAVEVVTVLLAAGGFLGNGLTVLAILTSSLSNNINGILIGNLSFASVLYCSLVLPMQALAYHHRGWVLPLAVCVGAAAIRVWLIGVTMCLLSAIAVYRFIHVVYPHAYRRWSERRAFYPIILVCWTFALLFCLGPMWGWGSYRFESPILQCTFNSLHPDKSHKITVVTIGYVIPCVFICVCYARIGCVVCRSRRRALRGSIHGRKNRRRGSLRLTTMMLLIFIGFFMGTTPYFLINVLDPRHQRPMAHIWAPCAAWLLYCLNPVIYTVMDKNFQQAYRQLICCRVCTEGDALRHVNSLRSQQSSI